MSRAERGRAERGFTIGYTVSRDSCRIDWRTRVTQRAEGNEQCIGLRGPRRRTRIGRC